MSFLAARFHQWHDGPVKAIAASADRVAPGGTDGVIRVMSLSGDHIGTTTLDTPVNDIALSPTGRVAIAAKDGSVRGYDPSVRRTYEVGDHDHWVMSVAWSGDGRWIASGSEDGTIGLWEPEGPGVRRVILGHPVNSIDWRGDGIPVARRVPRCMDRPGPVLADRPGRRRFHDRGARPLRSGVVGVVDAGRI